MRAGDERPPREKPGQLASRTVHRGRVIDLAVDTVRFPDGSTGELELVRHSGAAAVVPVIDETDPGNPVLLMLRQFRYATGGELLEIPAGRPDSVDEPWETCARRELEEETGFRAGSLEYLSAIWTTPGFSDELIHLFLARDLTPGRISTDADEFIAPPIHMHLSEALDRIERGEIRDAKSICAITLLARRVQSPR